MSTSDPEALAAAELKPNGWLERDRAQERALIGQVVAGKYRVIDLLGQGGFGSVFLVEMMSGIVGERLAMKLLPHEFGRSAVLREQFLNEIRVAMKMVDRYIVQIRDVGVTEEGQLYYTMDHVSGKPLSQILKEEKQLAVGRTLRIVLRVLRALETAHAAGIIHRDLKPANIMVEAKGSRESVRVLDFGIATAISADDAGAENLVKLKGFAGSPYYMPPEQFLGTEMGFYTDLYSVGVILYECVTGEKPYGGATAQEVYNNIKRGPPVPAEELAPAVQEHPGLAAVISRALERNPQKRFQSARAFFGEVQALLSAGSGSHTAPAGPPGPARPAPPAPVKAAAGNGTTPRAPLRRGTMRPRRTAARAGGRRGSNVAAWVLGVLILGGAALGIVYRKEVAQFLREAREGKGPDAAAPAAPAASGDTRSTPARGQDAAKTQASASQVRDERTQSRDGGKIVNRGARDAAQAEQQDVVQSYLASGWKALESGDWKAAAESADDVLVLERESSAALRLKGAALLASGDAVASVPLLRRARELLAGTPDEVEARLSLAEALLRLPEPPIEKAEEEIQAALALDPRHAAATVELVHLYQKTGREEELRGLIAKAQEAGVRHPEVQKLHHEVWVEVPRLRKAELEALRREARAAFERGDFATAAEAAAKAAKREPDVEIGFLLVDARTRLGDLSGASSALAELREIVREPSGASTRPAAPNSGLVAKLAFFSGAIAFHEFRADRRNREKLAESLRDLDQFLKSTPAESDPESAAKARSCRAVLLAEKGEPLDRVAAEVDGARRTQSAEAIELQAEAYLTLAKRGEKAPSGSQALAKARERLETLVALEDAPQKLRQRGHYLLGACYRSLAAASGDAKLLEKSTTSYRGAIEAGLKTTEVFEELGLVYDELGEIIRAAQAFRSAYDASPSAERCLRAVDYYVLANPKSPQARQLLEEALQRWPANSELQKRLARLNP
jgi:serine/threonine-protein kinase